MDRYRPSASLLRIAVPFLGLVTAGSLALFAALRGAYVRELRADLTAVASAHASFLKSTAFPVSSNLARDFSRLLNADVYFRSGDQLLPDPPAPEREGLLALSAGDPPSRIGADLDALAVPVSGYDLVIGRRVEPAARMLAHPWSLVPLSLIWLLAICIAALLARGVVVPLRALATRLPSLASDLESEASVPGVNRTDEIGLLARAFQLTRAELRAERDRRLKAERLALLGRMGTGLAHEIQNPVAAIRMHAQVLERSAGDAAAVSLHNILDSAARIDSLVRQWLYLARPAPPERGTVPVRALIDRAVDDLQPVLRHGGVSVAVNANDALAASGDAQRLAQVLHNLVVNAVQAMGGSGRIEIRAAAVPPDLVRIEVADSGPGFSAAALARGRELFFSEREGGMGVGLSVCDEIIAAHGGSLALRNAEGGGAVATVELPGAPT
jgi:signal transduction histidine kinase